ncbi:rho GTPase activator [Phlyctema vagabunda]|uniref:Rho GTPase activator n=1 Tax=Phlyctema vagabunda TaxID=108571 RepID=A0ABR4PY02_9HELO
MSSGLPSAHQQPFANPQPAPVPSAASQATSPPTKQNLKSWWKGFSKNGSKVLEKPEPPPIFKSIFAEGVMQKCSSSAEGTPSEVLRGGSRARCHSACSSIVSSLEPPTLVNTAPSRASSGILGDVSTSPLLGCRRPVVPKESVQTLASDYGSKVTKSFVERPKATDPVKNEGSDSRESAPASSSRRSTLSSMTLKIKAAFLGPPRDSNTKLSTSAVEQPTGIFGVPLRQSITYANVAISLVDAEGKSYIYGYVPIVVAKCGVYLKEKATNVEGIFRLSGSEKRIKELRTIFDSPDRYGKGLDWAGYTVHDAANVLRRYLNQLPEPIVPLDLYSRFREPLRGLVMQTSDDIPQLPENFDVQKAIITYQQLITELPPLNRQLLLYILDLLAVFASKSDENRMTSQNLSAIFQPGMLSHPQHDMAPDEYRLSQDVLIFLIENQDHFLIGMRGTAADEQTVQEVQNGGTPPPGTPTTPIPGRSKTTIARSSSNGSAGAESIRKFGGIRRNVSVSSRHSRQSNGAPSPASPAYGATLTQTSSSGVHRSNTVPSKRSPAIPSGRLQKNSGSPASPSPVPAVPAPNTGASPSAASKRTPSSSPGLPPTNLGGSSLAPPIPAASVTSQDRLMNEHSVDVATPNKDRNLTGIFNRSPTTDSDKKQPNKLRKKRIPESSNPSAQSSTHSLTTASPALHPVLPTQDVAEHPHAENLPPNPAFTNTTATPPAHATPRPEDQMRTRPEDPLYQSDKTLKPVTSPPSSLHSRSSYNDQSDLDQLDEAAMAERRDKKSRWRLSRKKEEYSGVGNTFSPRKGSDNGAGTSTSSIGSSARPRKSFTGDTIPVGNDSNLFAAHPLPSNESGPSNEEKKGPIGWLKTKIEKRREEKEAAERNKSPPASTDRISSISSTTLPTRGKSMDVKREEAAIPEKIAEEPSSNTVQQ